MMQRSVSEPEELRASSVRTRRMPHNNCCLTVHPRAGAEGGRKTRSTQAQLNRQRRLSRRVLTRVLLVIKRVFSSIHPTSIVGHQTRVLSHEGFCFYSMNRIAELQLPQRQCGNEVVTDLEKHVRVQMNQTREVVLAGIACIDMLQGKCHRVRKRDAPVTFVVTFEGDPGRDTLQDARASAAPVTFCVTLTGDSAASSMITDRRLVTQTPRSYRDWTRKRSRSRSPDLSLQSTTARPRVRSTGDDSDTTSPALDRALPTPRRSRPSDARFQEKDPQVSTTVDGSDRLAADFGQPSRVRMRSGVVEKRIVVA